VKYHTATHLLLAALQKIVDPNIAQAGSNITSERLRFDFNLDRKLTDEEKIKMCEIVTKAGADYIKTSTGFSKAGATFEDIKLFSEHVGKNVRIKAAGGISSLEDAYKFLELGADRLGTSRIVKLVKGQEATGY